MLEGRSNDTQLGGGFDLSRITWNLPRLGSQEMPGPVLSQFEIFLAGISFT
jgi:hypothetical protein